MMPNDIVGDEVFDSKELTLEGISFPEERVRFPTRDDLSDVEGYHELHEKAFRHDFFFGAGGQLSRHQLTDIYKHHQKWLKGLKESIIEADALLEESYEEVLDSVIDETGEDLGIDDTGEDLVIDETGEDEEDLVSAETGEAKSAKSRRKIKLPTKSKPQPPVTKKTRKKLRRRIDTHPQRVNQQKDEVVYRKFSQCAKRMSELQHCSTPVEKAKHKCQHVMVCYDELVCKPSKARKAKNERKSRAKSLVALLVPKDFDEQEMGKKLTEIGNAMQMKSGKGYEFTNDYEEYKKLIFGVRNTKKKVVNK